VLRSEPWREVNLTVEATSPRVLTVDNFLSPAECQDIILAAEKHLAASTGDGPLSLLFLPSRRLCRRSGRVRGAGAR
jgi:hypothetical protein